LNLIEAHGLTRKFDDRLAVDGLSMRLAGGQVLALLGPNGAGKTTTMRMLAGLLAPTSGSATVCGYALGKLDEDNDAIRARCGVVPEAPGFYERLSAQQNLQFFGGLQGLPSAKLNLRVAAELDRFGLRERANDRVGTYSKGMKQRLSLARALLHEPALLFLDEPTAGLDPRASAQLHQLIGELRSAGKGIVLSTHTLEEAEALADEILIIDTKALFIGRPQDLHSSAAPQLRITLSDAVPLNWRMPEDCQLISQSTHQLDIKLHDLHAQTPQVVASLVSAGAQLLSVEPRRQALRERYLELLSR